MITPAGRLFLQGRMLPRVGDQLELWTPEEYAAMPARLPWKGKWPRGLTKAYKRFSLGALPRGGLSS